MEFHTLDATAANLVAVYPKVQTVLRGEIPTPEVAEFFITNYCSFRCPHCRCAGTHDGKHAYIDIEVMRSTLDDLAKMGVRTIEFGGGGEPLEHPYIIEILGMLSEYGMRCGIITNGYALIGNEVLADAMVQVADWVRISLDAVEPKSYHAVHGRTDLSYEALREALRAFTYLAMTRTTDSAHRTRLGIKLIVQQCNRESVAQSFAEAEYLGADYLQFKWLENHPAAIPASERTAIINELGRLSGQANIPVDMLAGYGGMHVGCTGVPADSDDRTNTAAFCADKSASRVAERCVMSVLHPLIDWDGSVYVCAFFHHRKAHHRIGLLTETSFDKLWGSLEHRDVMARVDPRRCVPNCPLKRYNPIITFIDQEAYRFHYI